MDSMEIDGVSVSNFSVEIFSFVLWVVDEVVVVEVVVDDEEDEEEDEEVVVESDTFMKQEGQHSPGIVKLYSPWLHWGF